jgi:hypothetical protein
MTGVEEAEVLTEVAVIMETAVMDIMNNGVRE